MNVAGSLKSTAEALADAALAEFNESGFNGTDTNKIARRAGFAPQTFYHWYKDKAEIFVAAYRAWEVEELDALQMVLTNVALPEVLGEALIAHHRKYVIFRRSLRHLSLENPLVRKARAESRLRQLEQVRVWADWPEAEPQELVVPQLQLERLLDAIAEGELIDMGLTEEGVRNEITHIVAQVLARGRASP